MINNYPVDLEVERPRLQLCKNDLNRTIIANIKEAYNITQKLSLGNVNELSFSVPFNVEYHIKHKKNKNEPEIKERRIIKFTKGSFTEYYIVHKITKVFDDNSEYKQVECFSLAYELSDKLIKNLSLVSKTATQQLNTVLAQTNWTLDYINANFDLRYRALEISSATVLDVVQQIAETFNALIVYDTINRKISFYEFDDYGQYKGLSVSYGRLLKNITYETNTSEYCTRLRVYGKDGISINSVTSTGSNYLEDYSSILHGFQRDISGDVVSHAENISDGLAIALIDYQVLQESKASEFTTLLSNLNTKNEELIVATGQLVDLQSELAIIEDSISTANATGGNPTPHIVQKNAKNGQITTKNNEITTINSQITIIKGQITTLNNLLKVENNFSNDQLLEWRNHIVEKDWVNEFIDDPQQLLDAGKLELEKMREPKIVVNIGIVNLLEVLDEYHNWDKLILADIIRISVDKLKINIDAKIIEMNFDFESGDISLTISNVKEILNDNDRFMKNLYRSISTSTTFNNDKYKYLDAYSKSNDVYQTISGIWDANARSIQASNNETVEISRKGIRAYDLNDPMKVSIMQHGIVAVSSDGGNTWRNAITHQGCVRDKFYGSVFKLI